MTRSDDEEAWGGDPSDPRLSGAFRAWLEALGSDPEAATAAAMAYEALDGNGRDAWLDAIDAELPHVAVPALALYAPLFGVEVDDVRRGRMEASLATAPKASPPARTLRALYATHPSGDSVAAIVIPLYLDFVELLVCRYQPDMGVTSARRGPLLRASEFWSGPRAVREVDGVVLEELAFSQVVEGLAHALLANQRQGRPPPEPLRTYDFIFAVAFGAGTPDEREPSPGLRRTQSSP